VVNAALHREKVAIARRLRALRAEHCGCIVRRYSDGRDSTVNGFRGSMFCVWCPDADTIPDECPETCAGDYHFTCNGVGLCPCSLPYSKARLRDFVRWITRRYREQIVDRLLAERRWVDDDVYY